MEFDITKNKFMVFDLEVENMDKEQLMYVVRIIINGIEYGFKGDSEAGKIKVDIPAFNTVVKDGTIDPNRAYEARLDVFDGKFFITPWSDSITFSLSPTVKATLTSEKEEKDVIKKSVPSAKVATVSTNGTVNESRKKSSTKLKKEQTKKEIIIEKDDVEKLISEKIDIFKRLSKRKQGPKKDKIIKESVPFKKNKPKSSKVVPEVSEEITKKDLYNLMESKGMRSSKTQEMILERVESLGGDGYKGQYLALRKMLGIDKQEDFNTAEFFKERYGKDA